METWLICIWLLWRAARSQLSIVPGATKNWKSREGDLSTARSTRNDILSLLDSISDIASRKNQLIQMAKMQFCNCGLSWSGWTKTIDFFSKLYYIQLHFARIRVCETRLHPFFTSRLFVKDDADSRFTVAPETVHCKLIDVTLF